MNFLQKLYHDLIKRNTVKVLINPVPIDEKEKPQKWFLIAKINGIYYGFGSGPLRSINHYFKKKLREGEDVEKSMYIHRKETKLYLKKIRKTIDTLNKDNHDVIYELTDSEPFVTLYSKLTSSWNESINKGIIFSDLSKARKIIKVKL